MTVYKTVLAPSAPWPVDKPKPRPKPKPRKKVPKKVDLNFEAWVKKQNGAVDMSKILGGTKQ